MISGLDEIEWTKLLILRSDIELTCTALGLRCNGSRLRWEMFIKNKEQLFAISNAEAQLF